MNKKLRVWWCLLLSVFIYSCEDTHAFNVHGITFQLADSSKSGAYILSGYSGEVIDIENLANSTRFKVQDRDGVVAYFTLNPAQTYFPKEIRIEMGDTLNYEEIQVINNKVTRYQAIRKSEEFLRLVQSDASPVLMINNQIFSGSRLSYQLEYTGLGIMSGDGASNGGYIKTKLRLINDVDGAIGGDIVIAPQEHHSLAEGWNIFLLEAVQRLPGNKNSVRISDAPPVLKYSYLLYRELN